MNRKHAIDKRTQEYPECSVIGIRDEVPGTSTGVALQIEMWRFRSDSGSVFQGADSVTHLKTFLKWVQN